MESSLVVESPATAPAQRIPVLTPKTIFIIHPSDLLTDHKPNGDGLVACDFIKGLAKRGHRLLVAARNTDLAQSLPSNVIIYHLPTKIKIPMLDRLEYMWRVRRLFKRLAQREQIDLAHQMNPVFSGLSLALAGIKIPLVLGAYVPRWPNDPDAVAGSSPWAKEFFQSLNRFVCSVQQRCATVLMLTSPAALNRIPFPEQVQSKIFPIAIGIDTDIFSPLTQAPRASKPTILFLANLQKKKGIFVLLDAFADVFKAIPNCRLIVAGAGPEAEAISQKLQAMDCKHNVELVGRIERPDVPALLHRADVFCLPSFGEPYGAVILEAMSSGKAIVATDAGGIPHLVPTNGRILVPPQNAFALAAALIRVVSDEPLRRSMGIANRAHVEEHLSWPSVIDQLEQGYSAALNLTGFRR
jgi:glycosyltransferase involved in cell wall biosynthesis